MGGTEVAWGSKRGHNQGFHVKCGLTVLKFHLCCSGLNSQLSVWRRHKAELSFAIESVVEAIESYEMRIPEDDTCEAPRNKALMRLHPIHVLAQTYLFRTVRCCSLFHPNIFSYQYAACCCVYSLWRSGSQL